MRELNQEALDLLYDRTNIRPAYLIEIDLGTTQYYSTGVKYEHGGLTYEAGRVQGLRVGGENATFGLMNENYEHTTPALTGQYQRAPVKIYWASGYKTPVLLHEPGYVEEGYYDADWRPDPILVFEGNISRFTQITTVLGVEVTRSAAKRYPSMRVLPPIANYVRTEGITLSFAGGLLRLDPRRN